MKMYKMLGVTDEITTCECCGKTNLKRTVALQTETGIVYYGSDCAAKAISRQGNKTDKRTVDLHADVFAYAQKWAAKYDLQTVAQGIWNKFGFLTEVKNNAIVIVGIGEFSK